MSLKNIKLKKSLGQHLLVDQNICSKILKTASLDKNDYVLEIGAGLGHLTKKLAPLVKKIISVEIDRTLFPSLEKIAQAHSNLELIHGDILRVDLNKILTPKNVSWKVIANIPYYISSPIITTLIKKIHSRLDFIVLTMQLEVCQRLAAKPGTKDYGALTVFAQFYTTPKILFKVPRKAFYPSPKVESAVIKLIPRHPLPFKVNHEFLFKVVRMSFSQRRKKLINCLANKLRLPKKEIEAILSNSGINSSRRGETLSLEEFVKLSKEVKSHTPSML